ncbi:Uncharacterised protein [Streptococcus pneumoniae]|nr:Uncharacterised protein [Streptococcus pneumoniae]
MLYVGIDVAKNKLEIVADTSPTDNFLNEKRSCFSPKYFSIIPP